MALPSLFKRGCDEAYGWGWVGEPFLFLSAHCFSSFCLNLIGIPTSRHFQNCACTSKFRPRFNALWLNCCPDQWIKPSLHPHDGKICVLFSLCHTGYFWNRNGSRVLAWLGWLKEHCLIGVSSQRGFAWKPLREPFNFQVVASGSQHPNRKQFFKRLAFKMIIISMQLL